jgi:phosphinothricin acetyltransferase
MSPVPDLDDTVTSDEVVVRIATTADAVSVARIYNYHVDLGGSTFDATHWNESQVKSLLTTSLPEVWLVADDGGSVVGWASARHYSLRHGYRFTLETAIYLDPSMIGRGIASTLQSALERSCVSQRIHHLVAKIVTSNQRSMAFHYRHGYELVGVQKEVGHMDQQWQDVAILQKLLPLS